MRDILAGTSKIPPKLFELFIQYFELSVKFLYHSASVFLIISMSAMRVNPSRLSIETLHLEPFAKPPMEPSDLITLWQGTLPIKGFLLRALPTALDAAGHPIFLATQP